RGLWRRGRVRLCRQQVGHCGLLFFRCDSGLIDVPSLFQDIREQAHMAMEKALRIYENTPNDDRAVSTPLRPAMRRDDLARSEQYYCKEAPLTSFTWARYSDSARRVRRADPSAESQRCINAD